MVTVGTADSAERFSGVRVSRESLNFYEVSEVRRGMSTVTWYRSFQPTEAIDNDFVVIRAFRPSGTCVPCLGRDLRVSHEEVPLGFRGQTDARAVKIAEEYLSSRSVTKECLSSIPLALFAVQRGFEVFGH